MLKGRLPSEHLFVRKALISILHEKSRFYFVDYFPIKFHIS